MYALASKGCLWKIWYCGEPAISLHYHHVSLVQWTTCLLPVTRDPGFQIPRGYLCETGILLLALSSYIGDPDVIDHHGLVSGGLRPEPSLGPCADNNPTWSHTAFLSWFHARCRSPFQLHNRRSRLLGGYPVESLQSHFIITRSYWSSELPVCFPSQGIQHDPYQLTALSQAPSFHSNSVVISTLWLNTASNSGTLASN